MTSKTTVLIAALIAGGALTVAANAEGMRGHGQHMRGMMEQPGFEELDANSDGFVTQEEMQAHHEAEMAARFAEADTNGDGGISAEEMMAHAETMRANRMQRRIELMIADRDTNGDGMLQADEMGPMHMQDDDDRGDMMEHMFSELDENDDGKLSAEEFAQHGEHERGGRHRMRGEHGRHGDGDMHDDDKDDD